MVLAHDPKKEQLEGMHQTGRASERVRTDVGCSIAVGWMDGWMDG